MTTTHFTMGRAMAALAAGLWLLSLPALAQQQPRQQQQQQQQQPSPPDHADIERTQIIGNRELPKILYIVPWKAPEPGEITGRPVASVLDEALAPIDREVFRRQVAYHQMRHPPAASPAPSTATAAGSK